MRSFSLLIFLLICCLTVASSDYDDRTCGLPSKGNTRNKRSDEASQEDEDEYLDDGSDDDDDEDEEVESGEKETDENDDYGVEGADDTLTEKAMGGTNAEPGELPWSVLIQVRHTDGSTGQCGGTLVSRSHLITAAHCFRKPSKGTTTAKCNPHDMMSSSQVIEGTIVTVGGVCMEVDQSQGCTEDMVGKQMKVKRIAKHDAFFERSCIGGHDLALLELSEPVPRGIHHACLPHRHNMDSYEEDANLLSSFGFGGDPLHGLKRTTRLQKVELGLAISKEQCKKSWQPNFEDILCTKEEATKNVCTGDSGGGILTQMGTRFVLLGVISFGTDCDTLLMNTRTDNAQINTDIRYFSASIDRFIGDLQPRITLP